MGLWEERGVCRNKLPLTTVDGWIIAWLVVRPVLSVVGRVGRLMCTVDGGFPSRRFL